MVHVRFLGSAPCFMAGFKSVFGADDFSFEERRQGRVVLREAYTHIVRQILVKFAGIQTLNPEIATKI